MKTIEITKIEILKSGKLVVTPVENWNNLFQFIYRTATGVDWDEETKSFIAPSSKEWSYFDWYANIVTSVISELGVNLKTTQKTEWQNVPEELKEDIASYGKST
jgi:hypothetical protein